jgi:hypothetical protein
MRAQVPLAAASQGLGRAQWPGWPSDTSAEDVEARSPAEAGITPAKVLTGTGDTRISGGGLVTVPG